MGNKCLGSSNKEKLSQDDLEPILAIDPQDWTQGQVIKWLQLTHDGDLRDLIDPFKAQKISGVTFVKLSEENLKNDLEIKQFGLRDGFISARNKLLQQSKQNKLKPTPQQPSQTQTQAAPQQPSNANINTTPNDPNHEQDSLNAHKDMPIAQSVPIQNPLDQNTKPMVIDSESNEQLAISNPNPNPMSTEDVNHQHQHTSSNNHLITKPVNPRLNSSFDNPTDSMPNHAMSPLSGSNLNNTNPIPTNTSNVVVNGGYEVIPDILSPHSQGNAGFKNMPDDAFKDGPLQPPDDNYAQIDFADLHHTDAVPSIAPHLIPNGHSVHNAAYGVNGYPTGPGGAPPTQLYQMTSYQSNHVPFGQIQSMQTMPAMGAHPGHAHAHHHHHNQTGSNYDELPLEFIHNIPNAPNDASQQAMSGMSGMSGYQAIEFNDTLHDDNLPDNVSSVPSNAPSSNQNNGVKLAIGSCVKVLDRGTNKWVEAEVERLDSLGHNVYVKYLNSPNTRILVSTRDIRQLLPPNHAHNSLNHDNADIQIQHVNPSGDHPPIMSLEEKAIHEFARDLWKTLHKIDVKTIPDANNDPIRGFSGKELVRHVKRHLKKHVANLNDKEIILRCSDLVQYQYIRLIASAKDKEKEKEKDEQDDAKENKIIFLDSEKFLYQFENEKHREFIKDDQPDRRAWTRGTKVEIYSSTLGGWQTGTVVEVNNDTLTITYGPPSQQMRKTLDRYQDDLVKSSATFISNRKSWNKDSEIEVYSHGQHIWCQGRIEEVLAAKENQPVDIFRVFYTNNDDKDFSKYVDRWSPDLRQVQQLSPKLAKYKKGTKVRVWSNSKQTWVPGVVIDVVPTYEVVNVRYGDHEKLVPVSSDDIKLLADNTDDHHNQ
eukprot:75310_1